MSRHESQYLPSVTSPAEAIETAITDGFTAGRYNLYTVKTIVDAPFQLPTFESLADQDLSASNLFVIRLPDSESWLNIGTVGLIDK